MSFKRSIKRFAHVSGFTFVTYTEDGDSIVTCGMNDGDVRVWKEISDDDPSSFCIGESATCCAVLEKDKETMLIASTDANTAQFFKFPEGTQDKVLLRFSAPVTAIKISKKWIAAGSSDFTIKLQSRQATDEFIELKGHEGPILYVDMSSMHLASSAGDGTIRIWDLKDNVKNTKPVKIIEGLPKCNEFSAATVFSTPSFDAQGKLLAYPKEKSIIVLDTSTWETKFSLSNGEITGSYSVCSFAFEGGFLGAGSDKGEISVWNVVSKTSIKGQYASEDNHSIVSLAWNPKVSGELAFCDIDGQLSMITASSKARVEEDFEEDPMEAEIDNGFLDDMAVDDDPEDEENENCVSLAKIKNETLKLDGSDVEDDDKASVKSQASSISSRRSIQRVTLQPPFQPGSTPASLEHRFMCWNQVGQVLCHSGEENSIIAEFHDVTTHPSLHMLNNLNHNMASLSSSCLALATSETPCRLVCIAFTSSGNKEWSSTMPECEEIQGIAASDNFVAVATDAKIIRFFTTLGTQREVIAIPGPVVCISAGENRLAVVYNASTVENKLKLMIVTVAGLSMTSRVVDVPLDSSMKLQWLGFSDRGSVIVYDSTGRVLSYSIKKNLWFPICDMNNHISGGCDKFFIISVSESNQKIRATLCRGTSYPLTVPRPIVREVDFCLPFCHAETEKSALEESLIRAATFNIIGAEKTLLEKGLKLFSAALNSELESRAFEIIELVGDKKLIELAMRYASQKGRIHLSNKMSKLLNDFEEVEKQKIALLETHEDEIEAIAEESIVRVDKIDFPETSTPLIAPKPITTQKRSNPFRKNGAKASGLPSLTLNHLTKKSIGSISLNQSDDENISGLTNHSVSMDTPRPGNFPQWFLANKDSLQANNPLVTETSELMKIGKALYKELTQQQKPCDESLKKETSLNKRKLSMNDDDKEAPRAASKLAKFGFVEK